MYLVTFQHWLLLDLSQRRSAGCEHLAAAVPRLTAEAGGAAGGAAEPEQKEAKKKRTLFPAGCCCVCECVCVCVSVCVDEDAGEEMTAM